MQMLFRLARPILFLLDAEAAHNLTLRLLNWLGRHWPTAQPKRAAAPLQLCGVPIANAVGLAPGFIKNPRYRWAALPFGFGFIEVGTLTRLPQRGNPQPRMFRLKRDQALINRLGFNNPGYHEALRHLRQKYPLPIAVNLGKNKHSSPQTLERELGLGIDLFTPFASWFVVNLSSPNTPGLRALLEPAQLQCLLTALALRREQAAAFWSCPKRPLLLKLHPDLDPKDEAELLTWLPSAALDGVIATNTTTARVGLQAGSAELQRIGAGGLSGRPLAAARDRLIQKLKRSLPSSMAIIAVGGIDGAEQAKQARALGANAVEIYSALIFQGPAAVRAAANAFNAPD